MGFFYFSFFPKYDLNASNCTNMTFGSWYYFIKLLVLKPKSFFRTYSQIMSIDALTYFYVKFLRNTVFEQNVVGEFIMLQCRSNDSYILQFIQHSMPTECGFDFYCIFLVSFANEPCLQWIYTNAPLLVQNFCKFKYVVKIGIFSVAQNVWMLSKRRDLTLKYGVA